jgi:photosystem II stability/assembly factor-like uncharacterized protein
MRHAISIVTFSALLAVAYPVARAGAGATMAADLPADAATAAAPRPWQTIGPDGPASINSLAYDPQRPEIAFAGMAGGGIARSVDGGATWRTSSAGLTASYVTGLIVHPRRSDLVYASNGSNQLVRSLDGGLSWRELPIPGFELRALTPSPLDPDVVYVGSNAGLFVSRDRGDSWRRLGGGGLPPFYAVQALALDAEDPRLLYAGITDFRGFGLWVSQDGGGSWHRRLRAVPAQLLADPERSGTVYLLRRGSLQRSRDLGATWEQYFPGAAHALAFDPRHPWIAYVAGSAVPPSQPPVPLYKTSDDGAHWQPLTSGLPSQGGVGALAASPAGSLLADVGAQLFRSGDGGASWATAGGGLINSNVLTFAFGRPGTLFAGCVEGVYRSRDAGATWSKVLGQVALALAVDRSHPDTVYAGVPYPFGFDPHVVWKTTDGGDTWAPLPYPQDAANLRSGIFVADLAVDPEDSQGVYLAAQYEGAGAAGGQGVYRSPDGGQTWTKLDLPTASFAGIAIHAKEPETVWVVGPFGLYKSTDHGRSWSLVLAGSPGGSLRAVALAPSDPDVVWAAGDFETWRSADGGATWRRLSGLSMPPYFPFNFRQHPLAVDPADPYTLYAAWVGGVSRRSLGTSWQPFDSGLFNRNATSILFDPADPARLLVGTLGAGVFENLLPPRPAAAAAR